jgi:L-Ala-D/L-Glu epimerase
MKIVALTHLRETILLRETFRTAIRETDRVDALRIEVVLDNSEKGFGYSTATPAITGDTLESMESFLESTMKPVLVGSSFESVAAVFEAVSTHILSSPSGTAGVDLALHDLETRRATNDGAQVITSVTISAGSCEQMVATAQRRLALGFRVIKCKLGVDPDGDADRLIAVARTIADINPSVQLWVDANQGWTVDQTLRIVETATKAGVILNRLEQPTAAQDIEELATIRKQISIPLVADESAKTIEDIDRIASLGAADVINVKFMKFGGQTGAAVAVARAYEHGMGVLLGSMMEHPHSVAAAVRFAATLKEPIHDLDAGWWAMDTDPLKYADGYVSIADRSNRESRGR